MAQQQQNLQDSSTSLHHQSALNSPRRRKQPLDIDAALYLQSQAASVQEPNIPSGSSNSSINSASRCSPSNRLDIQHQQRVNQNQKVASCREFTFISPSQQQGRLVADNKLANNYHNYYNSNNNISVDYIDCVSNTDLATSPNAAGVAMRGIPSCRKHSRFHRNRVEPAQSVPAAVFATTATATATALGVSNSDQQQGGPLLAQHPSLSTASSSSSTSDGPLGRSRARHGSFSKQDKSKLADRTAATGDSMLTSASADECENPITHNGCHNQQQQLQLQSSVLYPISVSEVRKRTYFIGSVCQDSLLGQDELYRYFPNGRVSIFVCTWNQNRKRAPMNLSDLLLPDQLVCMPDIYAIGIQEAFSSQADYLRDWDIELQTTLGPNHVLLHSCSLGVLHLALFVRRDLIWFCSIPEESTYNSRSMPTNMIKTKGACSIAFRFFGTSFMFTNCHFPAHENKLKDRIDEYQRIINSIDLPKNLKLLKPRYLSNDSTARFDCVFFMGDLNFRLEQRTFDETIHILEDIFQQREPSYEALTQNDELLKVMETNQAFHGFDESQIKFPPTYKFLAQTNKYDRQTKRVPSYTDRILFRSKRPRHIQCLRYDWLPQLKSSDHKPVYCLFDVLIRPGHEQNMVGSLNAGLFQRAIYLEALKRRAEDPDGERNGVGGNLICSIS